MAERNHKQTLDELRDELWHGIANACALLEAERQIPPPFRAHGRVVQLRGEARRMIRRARAIDAVRAAANDAEVKPRLWQKRAEKAALPIIAGGSGRW